MCWSQNADMKMIFVEESLGRKQSMYIRDKWPRNTELWPCRFTEEETMTEVLFL